MRKNLKLYSLLALCCLCFQGRAAAQSADAGSTDALPFVRIDRDPRTAAMGFSGLASVGGTMAYSSFRNCAALPFSASKASSGFSYQNWAPGGVSSSNFNFGTAFKTGRRLAFSLGGAFQSGEAFDVADGNGGLRGTFSPFDIVVNAGVGVKISESFSAGLAGRFAREAVSEEDSYQAFCADAFLMYRTGGFSAVAGLSSVGAAVVSAVGDSFSLPSSVRLGLGYGLALSEACGLEFVLDGDCFFSGGLDLSAGAEFSFKDRLFLRAGRHQNLKTAVLPSFFSFGLGFRLAGLSLDAAFLTGDPVLGNTLTLGLSYTL